MTQCGAEFGFADAVFDVGAAAEPCLDVEDGLALLLDVRGIVGGDVGDDEGDRVGVGRGALYREGELAGVDGAAASGPWVGRDRLGVDPDPPDEGVGVVEPTCGGVVSRGDLGTWHALGVDPVLGGDARVGPPHRGVAFRGDREVTPLFDGGVGEVASEVPGVGPHLGDPAGFEQRDPNLVGIAASARRSIVAARGRTSSLPANRSAATVSAASAQVAKCGRPARCPA